MRLKAQNFSFYDGFSKVWNGCELFELDFQNKGRHHKSDGDEKTGVEGRANDFAIGVIFQSSFCQLKKSSLSNLFLTPFTKSRGRPLVWALF